MTTITEFRKPVRIAYAQLLDYMEKEDPNRELAVEDWKFVYRTILPLMDLVTKNAWPERSK